MGMQMQSRRIGAEVKRWCRGAGVQGCRVVQSGREVQVIVQVIM